MTVLTWATAGAADRGVDVAPGCPPSHAPVPLTAVSFETVSKLQVFRHRLVDWHLIPSIHDALRDCFVRYGGAPYTHALV